MSKSLATARQATLVVIKTEAGMEGVGEAWGVPQVNVAYLPLLKSYLTSGADVTDVELVFARILARHYHFGLQNQMMACLSGILAAKDAVGKETGLPVCRLIGGRGNDRVPVYASGGYLTEQPQRDFPAQIEAMAEGEYPAVKIKIGLGPKSDLERVAFARNRLGDAPQDFDGYARLRQTSAVPIATGEALYTVFDFKRLLDVGGVDVIQPDLSLCGGFWQGRRIAGG